jgi:hypothetical protein
MLKVCFCEKQVDGLTASRQILTSKRDSIKPPISLKASNAVYLRVTVVYVHNTDVHTCRVVNETLSSSCKQSKLKL